MKVSTHFSQLYCDVKYQDYNFDYVNLHRPSLSMNLLNLAPAWNYFMAAYLIRNRKYLQPAAPVLSIFISADITNIGAEQIEIKQYLQAGLG